MQFEARLAWERGDQDFAGQRYGRAHERCHAANSLKAAVLVETGH